MFAWYLWRILRWDGLRLWCWLWTRADSMSLLKLHQSRHKKVLGMKLKQTHAYEHERVASGFGGAVTLTKRFCLRQSMRFCMTHFRCDWDLTTPTARALDKSTPSNFAPLPTDKSIKVVPPAHGQL